MTWTHKTPSPLFIWFANAFKSTSRTFTIFHFRAFFGTMKVRACYYIMLIPTLLLMRSWCVVMCLFVSLYKTNSKQFEEEEQTNGKKNSQTFIRTRAFLMFSSVFQTTISVRTRNNFRQRCFSNKYKNSIAAQRPRKVHKQKGINITDFDYRTRQPYIYYYILCICSVLLLLLLYFSGWMHYYGACYVSSVILYSIAYNTYKN